MSDIPPPEQPGMYADARGDWWYWDGRTWSPAPDWGPIATAPSRRHDEERTQAVLMWVFYAVLGGWIVALVFYLVSREERPFVRHHSAEALNLTIALLVPQVLGAILMFAGLVSAGLDDPEATPPAAFWLGFALLMASALVNVVLGITGAVRAHRGRWWRLPIGLHPVRGVLGRGEAPPYDIGR